MKSLCVIIPIYKTVLSNEEEKSIQNTIKKLSQYDIWVIAPRNLNLSMLKKYGELRFKVFHEKYFSSAEMYSRLLLNPYFYMKFAEYEYMLIVQTDAYIIGDQDMLESIMRLDYDYWGAPWFAPMKIRRFEIDRKYLQHIGAEVLKDFIFGRKRIKTVGNGGLSLRKIQSTIRLLQLKKIYLKWWGRNEDLFFAYHGDSNLIGFRIPSVELAGTFSLEQKMREEMRKGARPFGVHAWEKWYPQMKREIGIYE